LPRRNEAFAGLTDCAPLKRKVLSTSPTASRRRNVDHLGHSVNRQTQFADIFAKTNT